MQCPACTTERLATAERHGIEIDYCPRCRGVWLDRGELDKLIERGSQVEQTTAAPTPIVEPAPTEASRQDDDQRRPGKHKSFLGEIFDFS